MKKKEYERIEGETTKQFEAFVVYRDLGITRSLREVVKKLDKSLALIGRWSSANNWVERVKKYDDDMDRAAILENEKKRRDMVKRHANQAMMFQSKILERLNSLNPDELSPSDLIRWFTEAVKIERLSRGESTDIAEVTHSGEVTTHDRDVFERVDKYAELYKKMANNGADSGTNESDDN